MSDLNFFINALSHSYRNKQIFHHPISVKTIYFFNPIIIPEKYGLLIKINEENREIQSSK